MSDNSVYDIGIFGLWYGRNYGSMITYYALNKTINKMGFSTVMIDNPLRAESGDLSALPMSHPRRFATEQGYNITPTLPISKMSALNKICRGFVLGSDQMWNYGLSRHYKQAYFLDFADDDRVKVSYGTSFGKAPYNGPESEKPKIMHNLKRFSKISVRDDFSKDIIENEFNLHADQVPDPVFLCEPDDYAPLLKEIKEDYIFAYILDPNPEIGKSLSKIAETYNKKIMIVFDEPADPVKSFADLKVCSPMIVPIISATTGMWLSLFRYADFVITDSFHGTCFASIFSKEFISLKNNKRGGKRFECLMEMLGVKNRMTEKPDLLFDVFSDCYKKNEIDYETVRQNILSERKCGTEWLYNSIVASKTAEIKYPVIKGLYPENVVTAHLSVKKCVGCGACTSICPTDALSLESDEHGYYRSNVDISKCVDCGKCKEVCPAIALPEKNNSECPDLFAFQTSDDDLLLKSASGGLFSLLAETVLDKGGVVAGAAWTDDLTVEHIIIDNEKDLEKLRKSKYLQSYLGKIFRDIKTKLEAEIPVLFSGCPCQVAGLKKYLGREYDNLLLVDLLCGNSPSAGFFKKYIKDCHSDDVKYYEFRYKGADGNPAWRADSVKIIKKDDSCNVSVGIANDHYQKVYHNHTMCAPHCEKCIYQETPRFGDITIGDFWGYKKKRPDIDVSKGMSVALLNNDKGIRAFFEIKESQIGYIASEPLDWLGGNGYALKGHNFCSAGRDVFYSSILTDSFSVAVDKAYIDINTKNNIKERPYSNSNNILEYDASFFRFHFDTAIWEEKTAKEGELLHVKSDDPPLGKFASMKLADRLIKGERYNLFVRFKVNTESDILNLHIKTTGRGAVQLVHSCKLNGRNKGDKWIEGTIPFSPNNDGYNAFSIGASQVRGKDNFIVFSHIRIFKR